MTSAASSRAGRITGALRLLGHHSLHAFSHFATGSKQSIMVRAALGLGVADVYKSLPNQTAAHVKCAVYHRFTTTG